MISMIRAHQDATEGMYIQPSHDQVWNAAFYAKNEAIAPRPVWMIEAAADLDLPDPGWMQISK